MKKILFAISLALMLILFVGCDMMSVSIAINMDSATGSIVSASQAVQTEVDGDWEEENFSPEAVHQLNAMSQINSNGFTIPLVAEDTPEEMATLLGFFGLYIIMYEEERQKAEAAGEEFNTALPEFVFNLNEVNGRRISNAALVLNGQNFRLSEVRDQNGAFYLADRVQENFIRVFSAAFAESFGASFGGADFDLSLVLIGQFRGSVGGGLPPATIALICVAVAGGAAAAGVAVNRMRLRK